MKAIEWQQFLQQQRETSGKVVYTPTELANVAGCSGRSIQVILPRLVDRGVLERYASGRYGLPGAVTIEDLLPFLDSGAYVTELYALYRHRLVTQVPREIRCFTNRRHNRSRVRQTPLGRIVFVRVSTSVYQLPADSVIAGPEQALCDFAYDCRRRGLQAESLVTFRNLESLDRKVLTNCLSRYPRTVASAIDLISGISASA